MRLRCSETETLYVCVCCKSIHCVLLHHWNVLYVHAFLSQSVKSVSLSVELILNISASHELDSKYCYSYISDQSDS